MKVLDPQSAILSNVEVLAHFTLNPPQRPPNPPPNANPRTFAPRPDLRDHNTVAKEFHDYVSRLSPHLLKYPSFRGPDAEADLPATRATATTTTRTAAAATNNGADHAGTPLDAALRTLITRLKPFQLTKAEVLMMLNLGAGLESADTNRNDDQDDGVANDAGAVAAAAAGNVGEGEGDGDTEMEDGGDTAPQEHVRGGEEDVDVDGDDYGAMAILSTVIEDRAERLTDEDLLEIIAILRETLGGGTAVKRD